MSKRHIFVISYLNRSSDNSIIVVVFMYRALFNVKMLICVEALVILNDVYSIPCSGKCCKANTIKVPKEHLSFFFFYIDSNVHVTCSAFTSLLLGNAKQKAY